MSDKDRIKLLNEKINKEFGWHSQIMNDWLEELLVEVRKDELNKCAGILYRYLVDNLHLPLSEVVYRIKNNAFDSTTNVTTESP